MAARLLLEQYASNAGGHEIGKSTDDHCFEAEASQVGFTAWRQRANSTDLDGDGTEIGEAAQRECGDCERTILHGGSHGAEVDKRHKFVEDHASTEQIPDGSAIVPGYP